MKKLLKKLKKNQFLSKISACLMIVVILVSSLGVSTFAADETEASDGEFVIQAGIYRFNDTLELPTESFTYSLNFEGEYYGSSSSFKAIEWSGSILTYQFSDDSYTLPAYLPSEGWQFGQEIKVLTDQFYSTSEIPDWFFANTSSVTYADSVLDVFTGITGAIIDSLCSSQNVFFTSDLILWVPEFGEYTEGVGTPILNFPSDPPSSLVLQSDFERLVLYRFSVENQDYNEVYVLEEVVPVFIFLDNQWFLSPPFSPAEFSNASCFIPTEPSFTLLGTLAVVGVGLALCFLFIGLISKFLRNRG